MKNIPDYIYLNADDRDITDYNALSNFKVHPKRYTHTQIKYKRVPKKRTNLQNASLHKWLTQIAEALNGEGWTVTNELSIEVPYSMTFLKEFYWKPIQKQLFEIESTTQMTTQMLNTLIDVFTKWIGEKGLKVPFPDKHTLFNQLDAGRIIE